jgi:hypothetical protein
MKEVSAAQTGLEAQAPPFWLTGARVESRVADEGETDGGKPMRGLSSAAHKCVPCRAD